jgi:FtsP/CotA-like multicopper oxidase with cupredoxin domain
MSITIGRPPTADRRPTNRSGWHRRTGLVPIAYLAAIVAVGLAHPFVPQSPWLLLHLLLLGAATNAILVWGAHFSAAVLHAPPDLAPVDREYLLVQSELYLGAAGQLGDLAKMEANRPDAVMFNGYVSQYAFRPLTARTGERVRIWVLDAGPNRSADFHVVGAPFDTVYAEGAYRLRAGDPGGAQVLDLAPASGGFVEAVFGQPGRYPFLTHAMADADAGAHGSIQVTG